MFFFIFCSFGATTTTTTTTDSKLTPYSTLTSYSTLPSYSTLIHQARDDATSPTTTQHHQLHSPSNVHRVVTLPAGRMEMRRGGGEVSRQSARADRCCEGSVSACFSEARRDVPPKRPRGSLQQIRLICLLVFPKRGKAGGRGSVSSPDWRTRLQRAQKRAVRSAERTCGESARRVLCGLETESVESEREEAACNETCLKSPHECGVRKES